MSIGGKGRVHESTAGSVGGMVVVVPGGGCCTGWLGMLEGSCGGDLLLLYMIIVGHIHTDVCHKYIQIILHAVESR